LTLAASEPGSVRASRPRKKTEYEIRFATRQAEKSWQDLLGTQRNAIVDAWDFLTKTPMAESLTNHRMKAELATVVREGKAFDRWQYELSGGARIWFYVDELVVHLVDVHTRHPNQTKR
jgi:mRNA-degrading endonuclease RelE of RelBE toxin-antitoxin system